MYYYIYNMNFLGKISTLSDENNPNILSNELDQAPKIWKFYEKRLKDPEIHQEIVNAMDKYLFIDSKEWDWDEILKRLDEHKHEIPLKLIHKTPDEKVSFLVKKEKKWKSWRNNMIWIPLDLPLQFKKLWIIYKQWEWIKPGDIWTYITFTKTKSGWVIIWAEQIELPSKETLLPIQSACHKVLTSKEFMEIMNEKETQKNKEI